MKSTQRKEVEIIISITLAIAACFDWSIRRNNEIPAAWGLKKKVKKRGINLLIVMSQLISYVIVTAVILCNGDSLFGEFYWVGIEWMDEINQ